jgi:signal transduction histidine kinase
MQSRDSELHTANDELSALRRIAMLVAEGVQPPNLFAVVAEEVGRVVDVPLVRIARYESDGTATECASFSTQGATIPFGTRSSLEGTNVLRLVRESCDAARIDDYSGLAGEIAEIARRSGIRSAVGSPIVVGGQLWGAVVASSTKQLPERTEARLADFTELLGSAIANAESREDLGRLADEQAALRLAAVLVAQGARPAEIFGAVCEGVGRLLGTDAVTVGRFETDPPALIAVAFGKGVEGISIGSRWEHDDAMASTRVFRTGRSERVDRRDLTSAAAPVTATLRRLGLVSTVASPIVVEGRLWGALTASTKDEPLPLDAAKRLEKFCEIVATAIASAASREALARLADEQAALRRVATLVAQGVRPAAMFAAVSEEVDRAFGLDGATVGRFEPDGSAFVVVGVAKRVDGISIGSRWELNPLVAAMNVLRTGRSARVEARDLESVGGPVAAELRRLGLISTVASPIIVESRLWGAITVVANAESLPFDTEERLEKFADLVAIAIANAESRESLQRLAEEQAALGRVAMLVAHGVRPVEIFAAVSGEVSRLFGSDLATVGRFDADGSAIVVMGLSKRVEGVPVGSRWDLDDSMISAKVYRTGRSARIDAVDRSGISAPNAEVGRRLGTVSSVSSPIMVEGRLWGSMNVVAKEPLPLDTEQRLEKFTGLVAAAIANAESRSELAASRRRIVTASDEARRRIERDLHDGTQQRLVSLGLAARTAEANVPEDMPGVRAEFLSIASGLAAAVAELQELSRGIHPAILTRGGVGPALRTLARRSKIPVEVEIPADTRLPEPLEVAAYFVASEALANAAKHARASYIEISLTHSGRCVLLSIRDDGVGGADPARGSGLLGLCDRVEALGGSIRVDSRHGHGTHITAQLPVELEVDKNSERPSAADWER